MTTGSNLPHRGFLYGNAQSVHNHGNIQMRNQTDYGTSFFFYAEKTGTVTALDLHERISPGYSNRPGAGNHGVYDIEIRPADPATVLPIPSSAYVGRVLNYTPDTGAGPAYYKTVNLTTPAPVIAGQPYAIVYRKKSGGHFSQNVALQLQFFDSTWPVTNYIEPGRGPGAGAIVVERLANTVEYASLGSSPARLRGWSPHRVNGVEQYPLPCAAEGGVRHGRRLGNLELALVYSDGERSLSAGWGSTNPAAASTFPSGTAGFYRVAVAGAVQARFRFRVTWASRVVSGVFVKGVRGGSGAGNFVVRLESGVTTDVVAPDQNGTLIDEFPVNSNLFLLTGPDETIDQVGGGSAAGNNSSSRLEIAHWVWIPFDSNPTFTLGQYYVARFYCTGSADVRMHAGQRMGGVFTGATSGRNMTWTQWVSSRHESREAWEDSKDGMEASSNSGTAWQVITGECRTSASAAWFRSHLRAPTHAEN